MDQQLIYQIIESVENIPEPFCILNSKMEFQFVNNAAEIYFSKSKEELLNKYYWDYLPEYKKTVLPELYETAFKEQTPKYFEVASENTIYPLEVKLFPNKNGLAVVLGNLTYIKRTEEKERYYDRLKTIGEMAAGVAHEIRNPLTSIKGFLQLMTKNIELKKYEDMLNLMVDEVNRINEIVTVFLDLAKNKTNKLELSNLNDIIMAINPLLETRSIEEGKYIKLELDAIPKVNVDKNEIRQLLLNLVNNSLDAIPKGTSVYIATKVEDQKVVLSVKDEGKGIPLDIIDKLGVPFVTSKEHGTGLGIPICFSIAERNNAEISYTSNSSGTTFNISFSIPNNIIQKQD